MSEFKRITADEAGISPASLAELYRKLEDPELGLHSFLVYKNGGIAAEAYWEPYRRELGHTLFSASKTYTGLAVGFAVEEGVLSLDQSVVSFFQDRLPAKTCENMEKMTVRHLLTMSTGFAADPHDFNWPRPDDVLARSPGCFHEEKILDDIDWVRNFFHHYVAYEPGTEFVYCTHGTYMLSVIVQLATGRTILEYLEEKLFGPLGITGATWELDPKGYDVGGWGLMVKTEDLLKTGIFLMQKGRWKDRQLLSEDWVNRATTVQIPMHSKANPDMAGYGYQIWVDSRENAFSLRGACGQICTVFPELGAVVVYTAGANGPERQAIENLVWEVLVPGMKESSEALGKTGMVQGEALWEEERKRISGFRIPVPAGRPSGAEERLAYSGRRYRLGDNRLNWNALTFHFSEEGKDSFTLESREGVFTAPIGFDCWAEGETSVKTKDTDTDISILFEKVAASGAWKEDGSYCLKLCFEETSYINTLRIRFVGNGIFVEHTRNCSFMESTDAFLTGVVED
ncbi:beta-lactamase family protein [Cuneatibacter sp. NSJ-177]|uniref:serine hydrolase domain-containing protein n=1 Tax=Cuneatibacter sp. NSJ-177 TaxID=2931401 RepID=UPI001FD147A2|nr:serine hydrolase [Cuneatibacter sp. NSJ-177]MCJ7834671.1 beta-lactamase family protein [Cuneatibacter sp. NSJ-177]